MILSEKRFAVQRLLSNGEVHYYDDLNCALSHKHPEGQGVLYVRPDGDKKWVLAVEAKYRGGLRTPMNSGFGAQKEGGNISFAEIKEKFKE